MDKVLDYPYTWYAGYRKNSDSWYASASNHKENTTLSLNYFICNININSNLCVDHVNHNTLDNRKCNLRITETIYNSRHRKGKNRNNVSGYRNVAYIKGSKKPYRVQLQLDGKNTILGQFENVDEAGLFAEKMRHKYYGEYAGNG